MKPRFPFRRNFMLPALILAGSFAALSAQASTFNWTGDGSDGNWNTGANWGGTAPSATGQDLVFDTTKQLTGINNLPVTSVNSITYNSTAGAFSHTISSGTLTLAGNLNQNSANTETLDMSVLISGARTVTVASGGKMVFGSAAGTSAPTVNGVGAIFTGATAGVGEVDYLSTGNLLIGNSTSGTTLNMANLGTFQATVGEFRIASVTGMTDVVVTLAASNTISASKLTVGSVNGTSGNSNASGTMKLGTTNTLNVDTIGVGLGGKATTNSSILFNTGLTNPTVTIAPKTDPGATGRTNITLGQYSTSSGAPNLTGSMDFTGGTVTASKIGTLTAGYISAGNISSGGNVRGAFTLDGALSSVTADTVSLGKWLGNYANTLKAVNARGTLIIKNGSMTVGDLLLAQRANVSANNILNNAYGTVDVQGGTLTVNTKFEMGNQTGLTGTVNATQSVSLLSITSGTVTSNVNITTAGTATNPTQTTLTLNGGTLDMTGKAIGSSTNIVGNTSNGGALNWQSGMLKNVASINGTAGLDKSTVGTLTLDGTNAWTGGTTVSDGTLIAAKVSALPDQTTLGKISVAAGKTLQLNAGGSGEFTATDIGNVLTNATLASTSILALNTTTGTTNVGTNITQDIALTKSGNGTLTLSGTNTYTGATKVNGGVLEIAATGSISNSSAVTVDGGTFRNNSTVADYSGTLTFTSGTIGGTNLNGSLGGQTIATGQTLSPGNSPGTADTTSQTWASGGTYVWEINKANGTAGTDPGWDLETGSGTLSITSLLGSEFNIKVISLDLSNAAGLADGFNASTAYSWKIVDFLNPITTFSADKFKIDATSFANNPAGTFNVALGDTVLGGDNTQLYLTYVPEPSVAALGALGMLALLRRRRSA